MADMAFLMMWSSIWCAPIVASCWRRRRLVWPAYEEQEGRAQPVAVPLPDIKTLRLYADSLGVLVGTAKGYAELGHDLKMLPLNERFAGIFPIALKDPRVLDITRAHNGDIWMGTPAGMAHLSKEEGFPSLNTIGEANGLGMTSCSRSIRTAQGRYGRERCSVGSANSSVVRSCTSPRSMGLGSNIISSMYRTPDGLMWFGTFGGGISSWNERSHAHLWRSRWT